MNLAQCKNLDKAFQIAQVIKVFSYITLTVRIFSGVLPINFTPVSLAPRGELERTAV